MKYEYIKLRSQSLSKQGVGGKQGWHTEDKKEQNKRKNDKTIIKKKKKQGV